MSLLQCRIPNTVLFLLFLLTFFIAVSSSENSTTTSTISDAEKIEQKLVVSHDAKEADEYNTGIKCGTCPCVNPCGQQLPPPPPPSPPPPPPPPPPKTPYCTPVVMPPTPPRFVYVTSLPEQPYQANIFPSNNWHYFYSGSSRNMVPFNFLFFAGFLLLMLWVLG